METDISPQLDYKMIPSTHPLYKFHKVAPNTGAMSQVLSSTGSEETRFEIPAEVFNFSKSFIEFTLTIPALGGGIIPNINMDTFGLFRSLRLATSTGDICSINDVGYFIKMVLPYNLSQKEYKSLPPHSNGISWGTFIQRSDNPTGANNFPYITNGASNSPINYEDQIHFNNGTAANAIATYSIRFQFSLLKDSLFAMDKDLFFGQNLSLYITWNSFEQSMWGSTDTQGKAGVTSLGANVPTVNNLQLFLAQEKNLEVIASLKEKVYKEGMSIQIPIVKPNSWTPNGVTSYTPSILYSSADGHRLLRVYFSIFNGSKVRNVGFENSALSEVAPNKGLKTTGLSLMAPLLDNNRLTNFDLNLAKFDDYYSIRDLLSGGMFVVPLQYYNSWTYLVSFGRNTLNPYPDIDPMNIQDGIDLSVNRKLEFQNTYLAANSGVHQFYSIIQRVLNITPNGIFLS